MKSNRNQDFNPYQIEVPEMCPVCCENFKGSDSIVMLSCNIRHIYHEACIKKWFDLNRGTCPLCKRDVIQEAQQAYE